MRIQFPTQRNSASSKSSNDSTASPDSTSTRDEEFGLIASPSRHPLINRINPKSSNRRHEEREGRLGSPKKYPHTLAHAYKSESCTDLSHTSTSLRLKQRMTAAQKGPRNILRSITPTLHSPRQKVSHEEMADVEFDWAADRRSRLERRATPLEKAHEEQGDIMCPSPRIKNAELSPRGIVPRREMKEEDAGKSIEKDLVWVNCSKVSAHPVNVVPYPLSYDKGNFKSDRYSHDLLKLIFSGLPSVHDRLLDKHPARVLDLGCGDGSWIIDAAKSWRQTVFRGLDLQNLHPPPEQLAEELGVQTANKIIQFDYVNFLTDNLPYPDEDFDMVRMANLKWAIPFDKWDRVLGEVQRVLKRGGWVEIIEDDFFLPMSPDATFSEDQTCAFDEVEEDFKQMLAARKVPLNISREFIAKKLSRHFKMAHEENFSVAIPRVPPSSVEVSERKTSAAHKSPTLSPKSASTSTDSQASRSKRYGVSLHDTIAVAQSARRPPSRSSDHSVMSQSDEDFPPPSPPPPQPPQPLGFIIDGGKRFIAFPPNALTAHAMRNVQSILACKEAIRMHKFGERMRPHPREWERKAKWDAFEDSFWEFGSTAWERLSLPYLCFDKDDEARMQRRRAKLQRRSDESVPPYSPKSTHTPSENCIPVRFIHIYSGWK